MRDNNCFSCKYQNIVETSHEWIDCFCEFDGKKHDVFNGCDSYEKIVKDGEQE